MNSIFSAYCDAVLEFHHKTALICNGRHISYRELGESERALSASLRKLGVKKGSVVGVQITTGNVFAALLFSILRLGAIFVPIGSRLNTETISQYIDQAGIEFFIYSDIFDDQLAPIISDSGRHMHWIRSSSQGDMLEKLISSGDHSFSDIAQVNAEDPALYLFTSGTTGAPKVAVHTYQNLWMWVVTAHKNNTFLSSDINLTYSPMNHAGGLGQLLLVICTGATLIMMPTFRVHDVLDTITRERPTGILLIPPTHCYCFEDALKTHPVDLSCFRRIKTGATIIPPDAIKCMFKIFPNARIHVGYGQSECKSITHLNYSKEEYLSRPKLLESCGTASYACDIRLVDDQFCDVPLGEPGEALVKSPVVMKGYLNDPSGFWEGWLTTGDYLKRDDAGYYYFVDRKRDIIKSGGELVSSHEVEKVFYGHPAIRDCAVIGIPSKALGEEVAIVIQLEEGASISVEEMMQYGQERLPKYKVPRQVFFVKEFLRTNTGKIIKKALRSAITAAGL